MKKKIVTVVSSILLLFAGSSAVMNSDLASSVMAKVRTVIRYDKLDQKKARQIESENAKTEKHIVSLDRKIAKLHEQLKKYDGNNVESASKAKLASLNYHGKDIIVVNNNDPQFSKSDLNTSQGAWQIYGNLDGLNRVTAANSLLNQSLMPSAKRAPLDINPTGWHNKKIAGGWLFNRCHLIGYQLTGQNNNIKNLMTGTRQLNDPDMLRYENEVANYLKTSRSNYVRYRVTPIFRGNELLARGVEMEGQSTGSNTVHFNVYIFNVEPRVTLNYSTGNSRVG